MIDQALPGTVLAVEGNSSQMLLRRHADISLSNINSLDGIDRLHIHNRSCFCRWTGVNQCSMGLELKNDYKRKGMRLSLRGSGYR